MFFLGKHLHPKNFGVVLDVVKHVRVLVASEPLVFPVKSNGPRPSQVLLQMSVLVKLAWLDEGSGFRFLILGVRVIWLIIFALLDYVAGALALPVLVHVLHWILTLRLNSRANGNVTMQSTLLGARMLSLIAMVFVLILPRTTSLRIWDFWRWEMQVVALWSILSL